jgi:hypothetical protein
MKIQNGAKAQIIPANPQAAPQAEAKKTAEAEKSESSDKETTAQK